MNRGIVLLLLLFCGVVYSQNCQSAGCGAGLCCSIHGYCGTTYEHCVSQCHSRCTGSGSTIGQSTTGNNGGSGVASHVSESQFNAIFPNRQLGYNYNAFIAAAGAFPSFGNTGDNTVRKREISAFFAQIGHETSFLQFLEEIICRGYTACRVGDTCNTYCNGGKSYHGRGPIQLSHHYNYNAAGSAIGANLLADPNLILRDPVVGFKTALWFWMTPQSPKPSCHAVMTGGWGGDGNRQPGFGMTTNIINGGLECGGRNPATVQSRINNFNSITSRLGTSVGNNVDCASMTPYG